MIWITKDKEFINGLQQQNWKDFVNGLQKMGSQCAEQQIRWAKLTNPAIMTLKRQSPASGPPLRRHQGQNPSSGQPKLQTLATHNQMQKLK